ncbi:MAG: TonB-dependent receptor [Chitinophagales bacterium]|nr:TonB-dependent receptor [Chitinophagaceae bacterium]MCB9065221.1 TonB-dependent receptor [Chitinophagales bacterium]
MVKGKVTDKESGISLVGVTVAMIDTEPSTGTVTDENGYYELKDIPVGKHTIQLSFIGYNNITVPGVLVTSAKEVVLDFKMEESATKMDEVVIKVRREHINEMALVSAKTFDVQETERYAGSRADPARMASNFAGVLGADDSRNDIIIRGNSPQGVLWRLEDVDIPNPNHFAVSGTSGGPVTMLNNKIISNSDFFTGAFPSEYGNSIAGVFDLKFRNGNKDRYEMTAQLGFLGTELAAEGPISRKGNSSFIFTYRYSTLKLFEGLNIKIGTSSVPTYQDASFKLNFPMGKKANLSFFGMGGLSHIDLIVSNINEQPEELYGESDRDQYFTSNAGVVGSSLSYIINSSSYTKLTVAQSTSTVKADHDKVFRSPSYMVDSLKDILGYNFTTNATTAHWYINKKFTVRHTVKAGILNNYYNMNFVDSSRQYPPTLQTWQHRLNYQGGTDLIQAYVQYKYRPSDALTMTIGLHGQYLTHNGSKALEPRAALRWRANDKNVFSLGYGLHSQLQPLYQYYAVLPANPTTAMHNYNVDFTRSHHSVAGYEHIFSRTVRLRSEVYYQYLFNVPIETRAGSSFSGLNQGASFSRLFPDTLVNKGTGYNYGFELTLEKTFSKGYYILLTGSVFDSKAKGNDGVYRNTDYNGRYAANILGGYELKLGKNSTLLTGAKLTVAGGRLYSPPDVPASNTLGDYVVIDSLRNVLQFKDYFRMDLKLGVRINAKKLTHEIALDLVNLFNTKNILSQTYNHDLAAQGAYPFTTQYQLGFLPLFYYRVDFGFGKK